MSNIKKLKGTINSAKGIYNYINVVDTSKFVKIDDKLSLYISLLQSLNVNDKKAKKMESKYNSYCIEYEKVSVFFENEMNKLEIKKIIEFTDSKILKPYKYGLRGYTNKKRIRHSEETLLALQKSEQGKYSSSDIYDTFVNSELKNKTIVMPNKETKELNRELLDTILFEKYSRDFKVKAINTYYQAPVEYQNTFASIFNSNIVDCVSDLRLSKYKKMIDMELFDSDINNVVINNIIQCTNKMLPVFHKYISLRNRRRRYREYIPELETSVSKYSAQIDYDDAVDSIKKALSVYGDKYINILNRIVLEEHVDVYHKKNKDDGGFEIGCEDKRVLPYILMNYTGYMSEAITFAHEIGHAINEFLIKNNAKNLDYYTDIGDFLTEVPSICNEFTYFHYMLKNAKSNDEKIFWIENIIFNFNGSIIRQMQYHEFELFLYELGEKDEILTADILNSKWLALTKKYYGKDVLIPKGFETRWSQIDHFFESFYVYKYATSCVYAYLISKKILEESEKKIIVSLLISILSFFLRGTRCRLEICCLN